MAKEKDNVIDVSAQPSSKKSTKAKGADKGKSKDTKKAEAKPEPKKAKSKPAPDIIIVDKFVKRSVAGLAFWSPKLKPFLGVQAWVDAKCPDEAYIYDTVDNLVTCGVPLRDARTINGLVVRIPARKPVPTKVNIAYATPAKAPEVKTQVDRIQDANTQEHHTMIY